MATDLGVIVVSLQGNMVDYLVWKHYGRQDGRRVEQVLDHARNYDLPDRSEILPVATRVCMPHIEEPFVTSRSRSWTARATIPTSAPSRWTTVTQS